MNTDRQHQQLVAERAVDWLRKMKAAAPQDRLALVRWMKQSPLHIRELLLATAWESALSRLDVGRKFSIDQLMQQGRKNVTPLVPADRDAVNEVENVNNGNNGLADGTVSGAAAAADDVRSTSSTRSRWMICLAAAAILLVALALGWPGIIKGLGLPQQYQTSTGEQRTISLEDGSVVYLNTQSVIRVAYSSDARVIFLDEGQAVFSVAHDAARPFLVDVERATVRAIGTQFDVDRRSDHTDVAVIEGLVNVTARSFAPGGSSGQSASGIDVPAGRSITITDEVSISPPVDVETTEVLAWRQRRLIFKGSTLIEIAAEFNRYNQAPKIHIEGETLKARRYSGVFRADDPESLLLILADDHRITFDRTSEEFVIIRLRTGDALASTDH